ncbi:hypothetical protein AYL99_10016 [Fonsecaea erecta]|uniref:Hsp70-like protein n=1 Tax=Fonsecaea erecta TaxID=1367422 RepID=A0A178Z7U3_9EURO|nr:hypothetical protein AYL99_10016 [Fonsecaea erecta]OAP55864.1 hypothetical protein AYL99_10016 [Fonsecaea erecta]
MLSQSLPTQLDRPQIALERNGLLTSDYTQAKCDGQQQHHDELQEIRIQSEIEVPKSEIRNSKVPRFIIAIDFGTTFSSVAYLRIEPGVQRHLIEPSSIQCIDNYPDAPPFRFKQATRVPSELVYCTQPTSNAANDQPQNSPNPISDDESDNSLEEDWASSATEDSDPDQDLPPPKRTKYSTRSNSAWGFGCHNNLKYVQPGAAASGPRILSRFKLLLDDEPSTQSAREWIKVDVRELKAMDVIQEPSDLIADYLQHLFTHVKTQLESYCGFREGIPVEFVISVPTRWSAQACRKMHAATARAIERSRFSQLEQRIIEDLFIVAESEAAAVLVLDEAKKFQKFETGHTFLIVDCGGGTVDATTYTISQQNPLRLREMMEGEGALCGSNFLNEEFKRLLLTRLQGARILGNEQSLDTIIESLTNIFEVGDKRRVDVTNKRETFEQMFIPGLQADKERHFRPSLMSFSRKEMLQVFKPCLRGVAQLIRKQLRGAEERGINIKSVILVGGFADSPSLRRYLQKIFRLERNLERQAIDILFPAVGDSAVARGSILRALRREDGPIRITRTSYGILHRVLCDRNNPKFGCVREERSQLEGELHIMNTISWLILKDEIVPPIHRICVRSHHTFKHSTTELLCEERLYMSAKRHESGHGFRHLENRGAELGGRIISDLTFLKNQNLIQPVARTSIGGEPSLFYEVEYDLWLIIEGRHMRFEARSPLDPEQVVVSASFSIAADFVPGTE